MAAEGTGQPRPLCVDLDGTLLRTDLLYETFLRMLARRPWLLLLLPWWLLRGKAYLKHRLAVHGVGDPALLPYDSRVLDLLQASSGRMRVLCTASDKELVEPIARHLGLFDAVYCSDGQTNLAGHRKADLLVAKFGDRGFDYVANAHVDVAIWKHAHSAWVVNGGKSVARAAAACSQLAAHWPGEGGGPRAWLKAMRVHQWLKNLLVFVPLLASHRFMEPDMVLSAALAFAAFGLCASGVYLLNDLLDLESDRQHPRKRKRPFACGRLSLRSGLLATPVLTLAGFLVAWWVAPAFLLVLALYFCLTLAYSLRLKQVVMIDVVMLAALYTIRIVGGAAAIDVTLSFWLLTFSMFIFLSLAMLKRYTELQLTLASGKLKPSGRGYHVEDLALVQTLGTASGLVSVLVLCLYINAPESQALYKNPVFLWFLCPVLLYWICRAWLLAHRGEMHDDPVVFAVRDPGSLVTVMVGAVSVLAAI
ncbi:UbiA family prenyltransferase [Stenotrophomonas rhizophila]|jgi:4-hydroxybenzoate polyprenyltransferase|uniref:UbiA family prenyltransferase n=1 Tax=Stenotrophomonas rhizophila TaxID=216778 RepID=UPI00112F35B3|nr:UbiA family prenyltransferase [Stenotrophomonas rhizophila]